MTITGDWKGVLGLGATVALSSFGVAVAVWKCLSAPEGMAKPQKWIRVGTVTEFLIYPVKSCRGINVTEATATQIGFKVSEHFRDRVFMIVTPTGDLVRMSDEPKLVLVTPSIHDGKLTLAAPGVDPITLDIPEDKPSLRRTCQMYGEIVKDTLDCGSEVSRWLEGYLGRELRLYYHHKTVTGRPALTEDHKRFSTFSVLDKGTFQDDTSYMFITEESLDKLNERLEKPVTHLSFRPNLVIKGTPEAFSENSWGFVRIGGNDGPIFKVAQPCLRCKVTIVDPEKGTRAVNGEPLKTLHKIKHQMWKEDLTEVCRKAAVFGTQLGLYQEGSPVRKGDPVYVALL